MRLCSAANRVIFISPVGCSSSFFGVGGGELNEDENQRYEIRSDLILGVDILV